MGLIIQGPPSQGFSHHFPYATNLQQHLWLQIMNDVLRWDMYSKPCCNNVGDAAMTVGSFSLTQLLTVFWGSTRKKGNRTQVLHTSQPVGRSVS